MKKKILTERKINILNAVVESYIKSSQPVGSRSLVQRYHYNLSPATIRNEMADLESLGYITQPHTSAGRIPTDKGYRFYVDNLIKTEKLDKLMLSHLNREYHLERKTLESIIRETSKVLSSVTHHTAVILAPRFVPDELNRIELVATGGKRILMLLVSDFGFVENEFIQVEEQISKEELHQLNVLLNNRDKESLEKSLLGLKKKSKEEFTHLYRKARRALKKMLKEKKRIYLDGTSFFLEAPEFKNGEKTSVLFKNLENEETFERIFKDAKTDAVKVLIGQESGCEGMEDCSIVFATYRMGEEPIGTVGIIGPKRMNYRKALTLVSSTAERLTSTFNQLAGKKRE